MILQKFYIFYPYLLYFSYPTPLNKGYPLFYNINIRLTCIKFIEGLLNKPNPYCCQETNTNYNGRMESSMTVFKVDERIVVSLTHTEASVLFGNYKNINTNNNLQMLALKALISEILKDYKYLYKNNKINVSLKRFNNNGCKIIISECLTQNRYFFYFENTEDLYLAVRYLYETVNEQIVNSDLYKFNNQYYLDLKVKKNSSIKYSLKDFGRDISDNELFYEYVIEYATPIILREAVYKYYSYY